MPRSANQHARNVQCCHLNIADNLEGFLVPREDVQVQEQLLGQWHWRSGRESIVVVR